MILRRLLYLAALIGALALYIFNTAYFTWVLLVVVVAFLPLELLLSLRCLLSARLELTVRELPAEAGGGYLLTATAPAALPVGTVQARILCANLFTGRSTRARLRLPAGGSGSYHLQPDTAPCGILSFSLQKVRVGDAVGLFRFPIRRRPAPVLLLARPPLPAVPPLMPEAALDQGSLPTQTLQRPGPGAMREFNDIREYRDGDSIRDVHWKLSAKLDKVMVREGSYSSLASPHLCFDFHGEPAPVCETLGRVESLSRELWELERRHGIHWLGADGQLQSRLITGQAEFDEMLWGLMGTPLPGEGEAIRGRLPEAPGPVLVVEPAALFLYQQGVLKEIV